MDERAIDWSAKERLDLSDDDEYDEPDPHPFAEVPGLEDCPLAGLRLAISHRPSSDSPTDRQTALWTQPRGGSEVCVVKTFRIDAVYAGADGPSSFQPLDLPAELPLTNQQWQNDNTMKKQQKLLGLTARALAKGLETMEQPLATISDIDDTLLTETRNRLLDAVDMVQTDAVAPLGHSLRFLASGFNDISFRRRDLAISGITDKALQMQVKAALLGMEHFFKEDISPALAVFASRQQQSALTSALRQRGSVPYNNRLADDHRRNDRVRSRSQRRDRARQNNQNWPFRRGSSRGGTSRGRRGRRRH